VEILIGTGEDGKYYRSLDNGETWEEISEEDIF
jgi:hypothetical protein